MAGEEKDSKMKQIIFLIIFTWTIFPLHAQEDVKFEEADSLFCHDSDKRLTFFRHGEVLYQFKKSIFSRILTIDSAIEFSKELVSIKSPSGQYLTFWVKGKHFFIKCGDTIYSINNSKIMKRDHKSKKEETLISLIDGSFTLIPLAGLVIHVSRSVGLVDKIFFEADNRFLMFEFWSHRGVGYLKSLSINHKQGEEVIVFDSGTLRPYIISSFVKEKDNWFTFGFREKQSRIIKIEEFVSVKRDESSRRPDYECKIYYTYNRKGILNPDFGVKVNVCE
jgi:hypothetical protein